MNKIFVFVVFLVVIAFLSIFLFKPYLIRGHKEYLSVNIQGTERNYIQYKPRNYNPDGINSIVIALHGGGESAQYMIDATGWTSKADEEGFLVIFPEGTYPNLTEKPGLSVNQRTWDDGAGRFYHHEERGIDDVAFINTLIEKVIEEFGVGEDRVFVTGFSNGASMTLRLGVELSDKIVAIAPVAGGLWVESSELKKPVSLIYISGSGDPLPEATQVQFGERSVEIPPPAQNIGSEWASMLACEENLLQTEPGLLSKIIWSDCLGETRVHIYSIDGIGHKWPSKRLVHEVATDTFDATDVIWDFFEATYTN